MKVSRERYQHGSVRKVPRSQGFAWEFRFYLTAPDGKRKLKVQTFDSLKYPTEREGVYLNVRYTLDQGHPLQFPRGLSAIALRNTPAVEAVGMW